MSSDAVVGLIGVGLGFLFSVGQQIWTAINADKDRTHQLEVLRLQNEHHKQLELEKQRVEYLQSRQMALAEAYSVTFFGKESKEESADERRISQGKCLSIMMSINDHEIYEAAHHLYQSKHVKDYQLPKGMTEDGLILDAIWRLSYLIHKDHAVNLGLQMRRPDLNHND